MSDHVQHLQDATAKLLGLLQQAQAGSAVLEQAQRELQARLTSSRFDSSYPLPARPARAKPGGAAASSSTSASASSSASSRQQADALSAQIRRVLGESSAYFEQLHSGASSSQQLLQEAADLSERLAQMHLESQQAADKHRQEQSHQHKVLSGVSVPLRVGGSEVFEVDLSTLAATPEGSYFRALLSFYDLEGHADSATAQQALQEVLSRNDGALPLDEDPDTFRSLLNYLRYRTSPLLAGRAILKLLPESEPQRGMLLAAAERLGLTDLVLLLTPRADVAAHFTQRDAGLREQEEGYRSAFVSDPPGMVGKWRRGELLLDVFDASVLPTFKFEAGPSPYPELFTHLEHPSHKWAAGERAVVSDLPEFKAAFTYFTGGLFEGVDWSNMIVAGGSVLACLLRPPSADELGPQQSVSYTYRWGGQATRVLPAWNRWLGPNRLLDKHAYEGLGLLRRYWEARIGGRGFNHVMQLASSGFGDSDIDIFFHGLTPKEATKKLKLLLTKLHNNSVLKFGGGTSDEWHLSVAARTEHAVTLVVEDKTCRPAAHIQVVLRLYSCPAEVLMGFDVDSCCVAFDGNRVFATPRARRAIVRRQNVVDPGRLSPSYESRLAKYAKRGFRVAVPGFPGRSGINSSLYLVPYGETKGLARLLRMEQYSIATAVKPGELVGCTVSSEKPWQPEQARLRAVAGVRSWGGNAARPLQAEPELLEQRDDGDVAPADDADAAAPAAVPAAAPAGPAAAVAPVAAAAPPPTAAALAAAAAAVSDYCSFNLPKDADPEGVLAQLSAAGARLLRAQQPSPIVWQEMRGYQHRAGVNLIDNDCDPFGNVRCDYVFNAAPLLAVEFPLHHWRRDGPQLRQRVRLSIPTKLQWLTVNPGRQGKLTGSFHPLEGADWTQQAYARAG